ncbi:hypothetical protein IPP92_00130 [Candidatus Saccharibacteria bacterium]|nr:MAG: hypothetical protein IPP92_00130 [Candidatus Saccharibacteria bacterium]
MLIKHVNNFAAVDAVTRQSVGQPCQNAVCLASLYALQHFVKLLAPWLFRRLFFYDNINNVYTHTRRKFFQLRYLRVYR